jgi:membrane protein YqaA with SNARE-associated domain
MVIMDTLFDVLSATIGAVVGAMFAFFLNRKRSRQMMRQSVTSRQELTALRQENDRLLQQIKTKEDIILKMQMQLLGDSGAVKPKKSKK